MDKIRCCVKCGKEYRLTPKKPGYITECWRCGERSDRKTEKIGGNMIWSHKTGPEIEIKPLKDAQRFARQQKRTNGACPLTSILENREGGLQVTEKMMKDPLAEEGDD